MRRLLSIGAFVFSLTLVVAFLSGSVVLAARQGIIENTASFPRAPILFSDSDASDDDGPDTPSTDYDGVDTPTD